MRENKLGGIILIDPGLWVRRSSPLGQAQIAGSVLCLNDWLVGKVFGQDGIKGYNAFCIFH